MQLTILYSICCLVLAAVSTASTSSDHVRCVMYLTGQHVVVPSDARLIDKITHVILAFMQSDTFNVDDTPSEFPLFTTVDKVRTQFNAKAKVMVAIGGWGDSKGFETAARDEGSRKRWSSQVAAMVKTTGADGVDIDWEYPGGNRDDYKLIPNPERKWEIGAFVLLLQELRSALGRDKLLSIAVPGLERDMMAFTYSTVPSIVEQVDFVSVMTYDLMNRRDSVVVHHSGVTGSKEAILRYQDRGVAFRKLNLGLGYYVKWFMTEKCDGKHPLGCPTQLLEDPVDGSDQGKTASFSWHDKVPTELADSFARAQSEGFYDKDGSYGYWDAQEKRWWSYDTPKSITVKMLGIVGEMGLGGVFAWGLGEDAPQFAHLKATTEQLPVIDRQGEETARDEL